LGEGIGRLHGFCPGVEMDVSRFLIGLGIVLLLIGLAWPLLSKLGLGRLPGDIIIERESSRCIFR
jgi:hypothetical protein